MGFPTGSNAITVSGVLEVLRDGKPVRAYAAACALKRTSTVFSEGETLTAMRHRALFLVRDNISAQISHDQQGLRALLAGGQPSIADKQPQRREGRMSSRRLLYAALATGAVTVLLSGCATLGPAYTADTNAPRDKGTVYVYRPKAFSGGAISYTVSVNGAETSSLPSGGYFVYYATPGETEFSAKTEAKTSVTVDVKAGQTYYVQGSIGMGVFVGHPHLTQVANDVGAKEIANCKLVPAAAPKAVAKTGS